MEVVLSLAGAVLAVAVLALNRTIVNWIAIAQRPLTSQFSPKLYRITTLAFGIVFLVTMLFSLVVNLFQIL